MKKRILSLLMALVMVMSLLPVGVMATESSGDSTIVYVSVAQNGKFVTGKDSKTIAYVPVTVNSQQPTIGDAFTALHEQYYDGSDGYATTAMDWGDSITKFWGVDSSNVGYYNNNSYAMGLTDSVVDGAHLVFWFYQGAWNADPALSTLDSYTYFDKTTGTVDGGEALELTLTGSSNCAITIDSEAVPGKVTDADGKVALYFAEAGTYIVSAKSTGSAYIVPPVCIVTVNGDDSNAANVVGADKTALTLAETVTTDLTLPAVGESGKTAITWATDNAAVISADGKVTRGSEEKTVKLTATLRYGSQTATKEFSIKVPGVDAVDLLATAETALKNLTISQWNDDATVENTNVVTLAQAAVDTAVEGITVSVKDVSGHSSIGEDGTITYADADVSRNVTFTITLDESNQRDVTVELAVPEKIRSKQQVWNEVTSAEYLFNMIKKSNDTKDNIIGNVNISRSGDYDDGYCVAIGWASSNADVIDTYGSVTRPAYGENAIEVTLTATIKWNPSYDMYVMYGLAEDTVGAKPTETKTVELKLTVQPYSEAEFNAAKTAVDEALNSLDAIKEVGGTEAADLTNVTYDLQLPYASGRGIDTVWASTNDAIAINTYRAKVTRPTLNGDDVTGNLTVTLSKAGYSASKTFENVTVKALTQAEIDAENTYLTAVKNALTFDAIKKNNLRASGVTDSLQMVYRGIYDNNTNEVSWKTSNSGEEGIKITWGTSNRTVVNTYGTVTRPAEDTAVTLTATLTSIRLPDSVSEQTVQIPVTVLAARTPNTAASLETIMNNIAAGYVDSTGEWVIMDMGAYAQTFPSAISKTSDTAKQTYLNTVMGKLSAASVGETTYSKSILALAAQGIDPTQLYTVNSNTAINAVEGLSGKTHGSGAWVAPYTLAAFNQNDYDTDAAEQAIIDAVLEKQAENGSWTEWGDSIQTTSNMIAGLAFYAGDDEVDAAIAKAVEYLSSAQKADGSFDAYGRGADGNTMAMVVIGLAANGINPDTDYRFIKNGKSALDGLLSFAVEGNNGFGYTSNATINASATEQGFRALIAAYNVMKSGTAYNVYDHSGNTLTPGRATGTGSVVTPSEPSGDNITVTFTIKSDNGYWLSPKSVTVPGTGATVYHAFMTALEGSGITQVGAANGYVKSMTKDGRTLAEFTNGKNSGWMYKVNGELPEVGLTDCSIVNGDDIVWFYTNDWTTVPGAIVMMPDEKDDEETTMVFADVAETDFFYDAVTWAVENGITNGTAATTFSPNASCTRAQMVTFLWRAAGSPEAKATACAFTDVDEDAYYYEALLWAIENGITNGTSAIIFSPDAVCTRGQMATFLYRNAKTPAVDGDHPFTDVEETDFYNDAVTWAAEEGITNGTTATTFSPDADCTRGQMAAFLFRSLAK